MSRTVEDFIRLLPGVPWVESPFFSKILGELEIDDETRRIAIDIHLQGYAVVDFPEPDFDIMAADIKNALHDQFDWAMWRSTSHESGVSLRAWDAWKQVDSIRKIAVNPRILDLLSRLYGRRAWPFQTLNFPVGTQQHIHSDAVHFSSNPERFMCGVWVALEDITLDNGPLVYYPGSHKWPIYTNEHIGYRASSQTQKPNQTVYEEMWRALVDAHHAKPAHFVCKKGQALIWAANLLHGGSPHLNKDLTRWSQVTHYFFEDCAYFTPLWSDPFDGLIYFRRPVNVVTGEVMENRYLGGAISEKFVFESRNGHVGFDSKLYLAANPDVAASGMDAAKHYALHGRKEERPLRP